MTAAADRGLSLAPFRALRPVANGPELGRLLCPPYDVIDEAQREALLAADPDNAVAVVLPRAQDGQDPYLQAARRLAAWEAAGRVRAETSPALYVYEMADSEGATRGLLGAVELRDPSDGVILPHENTMAGPVADRLALMTATQANLEPIYLVYDGGGAASELVRDASRQSPVAETATPDGAEHRLWMLTDPAAHEAVARDLAGRRALIADGHHRYATYLALQHSYDHERGAGPWDRGLTLLVDSSTYGPRVHAIHRVLVGMPFERATAQAGAVTSVEQVPGVDVGLARMAEVEGFAAVLTDGIRTALVIDSERTLAAEAARADEPAALADLDVTVLHRALVERVWRVPDTVDSVGYAHSVEEAIAAAHQAGGTAVLLRPTPVAAVAAVAAAGARMPRKSTLFTPKPASGLVMRRFADDA